jgi:septum formation topological specificity factor MinE
VQQLDEFQIFNKLASKVRGVSSNIKNKVKQIYVTIMKRVSDAFNYIKSLGKELVEAVMKFLGVEVKNVVVKGSGDFALR